MDKITLRGFFTVLDFSITHKMLLIRNTEVVKDISLNTDICFISTFYMDIPTIFTDIVIEQGTYKDCTYILNRCDPEYISVTPKDVFILYSQGKKYYVGARKLEITTNNLDPNETSLGPKR